MGEILIASKKHDRMRFRTINRRNNAWSPASFERVIPDKDPQKLAYLLYDLERMGYNLDKAIERFRQLKKEPELFFLK